MQKGQSENMCTAISAPQAAQLNTDPARSFTMAGIASDDTLRGKRYCDYSVVQTTAPIDSVLFRVASLQNKPCKGKLKYWVS